LKKENKNQQPFKIRLPGFVPEKEIGLGDLIKRATSSIGIKSCGGCQQRANLLNSWFVFKGKTK
jgi:hypothetical protein